MKSLSSTARFYILAVCVLGVGALTSQLCNLASVHSWLLLAVCCGLAAPLQVLKIEGVTARTSYNLGWILYGFAFVNMGAPAAVLVVFVAHLVEWLYYRYPWYIQLYNVASFSIAFWLMDVVYRALDPQWMPPHVGSVAILVLVFALLTSINHLLIGCAIYLARGQSFAESGVLAPEAWLIDFGLLGLGVIAAIVWLTNPAALLFVALVVFMLYRALLVPSLRRQTEMDSKTNVYNMAFFNGRMSEEFARAQRSGHPLTIVMADLDHLREVNNIHGHLAGDIAIQAVATCLTRHSRRRDLVARFGGEEFIVLMPDTPAEEAMPLVEAMRQAIAKLNLQADQSAPPFGVTMSFGVAQYRDRKPPVPKELIEQADQALYMAKHRGRNRVCRYSDELGPGVKDEEPGPAAPTDVPVVPAGVAAVAAAKTAAAAPVGVPAAWAMPVLVSTLTVLTAVLATLLLSHSSAPNWVGIAVFAILAVGAELANIEVYAKQTSVSTSVAPLLAGVLLFGPPAALCIGVAIATAAWLKYRSPAIRLLFNSSNHVLGGMLCVAIIGLLGRPLATWPILVQVGVVILCILVIYLSSTVLVALALAVSTGQEWHLIWREKFRWLGLHYVALSFVAFGLYSTYPDVGPVGILIVLLPLALIRYGQKQYISVTEAMLHKLRLANSDLLRQKQELDLLNHEMLKLLAAALDLRDPSVQSHSEQVAAYATAIARHIELPEARVELVRRAALLHDIGKLAVPDSVLYKTSRLSREEYAAIQEHPVVGANLLRQFNSLHTVTDFVLHHHEHFDGSGYPKGLVGEEIPLEARIVGLADAVEAMASARPYQPALPIATIKAELRRCAGAQFDPQIVAAFFAVLDRQGDDLLIDTSRPTRSADAALLRNLSPCMPAATN